MGTSEANASKWCQNMERFPVSAAAPNKAEKNRLDVIWVIDDSSSMGNHQLNLKNNLESFFSVLDSSGKVDFQMGAVTTGLKVVGDASGKGMILHSSDAAASRSSFMKSMMVGTEGSATEKGSEAVLKFMAIQPEFIRQGSHVSINILTDEDDESAADQVALLNETLAFLVQQGNSVSINLISLENQIDHYKANFAEFETRVFALNGADFKRSIESLAKKSIRSPIENLELKFEAEEILSVELIKQGKASVFEQYQVVDSNSIRVDMSKSKIAKGSVIEIQYRYACNAFDRSETKDLAGMISEIRFRPNSSQFLNEQESIELVKKVAEFMKKHPDSRIELIGTSSHSLNPIAWLKIMPFQENSMKHARGLAKSRANTIKTALMKLGIEEHRMEAKGAFPGLHRHWYSYLMDASCIDIIPLVDFAGMIESDRRVIMKVKQGIR